MSFTRRVFADAFYTRGLGRGGILSGGTGANETRANIERILPALLSGKSTEFQSRPACVGADSAGQLETHREEASDVFLT